SVVTESEVRPIVNRNNSLLYKAKINLFNRYYSGLIILKQTDAATSHLTFVTEIGMKMFDFEIQNNNFKLTYVFEPLNKPKIIKLLESDMKLILLQHLLNKQAAVYEKKNEKIYKIKEDLKYYYKTNTGTKTVEKIAVKGSIFTKEKVNYLYNDSLNAKQIKLKHKGLIRLRIELNNLNKTTE
ncbi:MAG: hypothetical protein ABIP51_12415, partial [Bacteroidia bacterium]